LNNIFVRAYIDLQQLYFRPLAFSDLGNYTNETAASEAAYLANPLHNLLRSSVTGTLMLLLTLLGVGLAVLEIRRAAGDRRRTLGLLLFAALILPITLIAALALPFQRYVILLVPLVCLWEAYALVSGLPSFNAKARYFRK